MTKQLSKKAQATAATIEAYVNTVAAGLGDSAAYDAAYNAAKAAGSRNIQRDVATAIEHYTYKIDDRTKLVHEVTYYRTLNESAERIRRDLHLPAPTYYDAQAKAEQRLRDYDVAHGTGEQAEPEATEQPEAEAAAASSDAEPTTPAQAALDAYTAAKAAAEIEEICFEAAIDAAHAAGSADPVEDANAAATHYAQHAPAAPEAGDALSLWIELDAMPIATQAAITAYTNARAAGDGDYHARQAASKAASEAGSTDIAGDIFSAAQYYCDTTDPRTILVHQIAYYQNIADQHGDAIPECHTHVATCRARLAAYDAEHDA